MFQDFFNKNVIIYFNEQENEKFYSNTSVHCVLLAYDTRFLKFQTSDNKVYYFNIDNVKSVVLDI